VVVASFITRNVAWVERSETLEGSASLSIDPDFASLNPGYIICVGGRLTSDPNRAR